MRTTPCHSPLSAPFMLSAALKSAKQPNALVNVIEHRLTSEASPIVSLAMTLPAGNKFSAGEEDCGQISAAYKHALLQGTKEESKISLARKADLRPSPISSTLTHDLLTLRADFHLNYLPEIVSTFKNLFSGRSELQIEEFDLENSVKEAVKLDGLIAYEDSRVLLLEAARRAAFRTNNCYFPRSEDLNSITGDQLNKFHRETLERSHNSGKYSFLLSVNDSKLIGVEQLSSVIQSCGIETLKSTMNNNSGDDFSSKFNEGSSMRIELNDPTHNEFMMAFNVPNGGFSQKDHMMSFVLESILRKFFPTAMASVTSDTSLLTIYFKFDGNEPAANIKGKLEAAIDQVRRIPEKIKDEDMTRAQERAKFNRALCMESRDSRLLTFAHLLAHSAPLNPSTSLDHSHLMEMIKKVFLIKPVLVSRGNYKKMPQYNELF